MHGGAEKVLLNLVNNMDHEKFDITVQTLFDVGVNKQFLSDKVHYITCYKKMFRGNTKYFKLFSPEKLYRKYIKDDYDIWQHIQREAVQESLAAVQTRIK